MHSDVSGFFNGNAAIAMLDKFLVTLRKFDPSYYSSYYTMVWYNVMV